jgi:iron complex transport system substrate-binding protein
MKTRIHQHKMVMAEYKKQLASADIIQFAVATEKGMWLHGPKSYAGSVLTNLGIKSPIPNQTNRAYIEVSLEQLLKTNPDWLLIGPYSDTTIADTWKKSPLFTLLNAQKQQHVVIVSPKVWSFNRGMNAAEQIAQELSELVNR